MKPSEPKVFLHLEGLVVLMVAGILYQKSGASWGTFAAFVLVPDLSMFGYLKGPKTGAHAYNLAHTYVGPFLLGAVAYSGGLPLLFPYGLIWVAHIGLDRLLGYGLKYGTDFKDTHFTRL